MSTERTEEYVLQWRTPVWWGVPVWEDYRKGLTKAALRDLLEERDEYRGISSDKQYRVIRCVSETTTTILEEDDVH